MIGPVMVHESASEVLLADSGLLRRLLFCRLPTYLPWMFCEFVRMCHDETGDFCIDIGS